jgi:hypothetical protein
MDPTLVEESPPAPEIQVSGDVDVHISLHEKSATVADDHLLQTAPPVPWD